jgi:hypothetical protein
MADAGINHLIFGPEGVVSIFKNIRQLVHEYRTKRKLYLLKQVDWSGRLEDTAQESTSRIKERYDRFYEKYGEDFAQGDCK